MKYITVYNNIKVPVFYSLKNRINFLNNSYISLLSYIDKINFNKKKLITNLEDLKLIKTYSKFRLNDEKYYLTKIINKSLKRFSLEADLTDTISVGSPNVQINNNSNRVQQNVVKSEIKINNGIKEQWSYITKHIKYLIDTYVDKAWPTYDKLLDIDILLKIKEHDKGIEKDINTEEREIKKEEERKKKEEEKEKKKKEKESSDGSSDDLGLDDLDMDLDMPDFNSYRISLEEDDLGLGDLDMDLDMDLGDGSSNDKKDESVKTEPVTKESDMWYIPKTIDTSIAGIWVLDNNKKTIANFDSVSEILDNTYNLISDLVEDAKEISNASSKNLISKNTNATDSDTSVLGRGHIDKMIVGGIKPTAKDSVRVHYKSTKLKQLTIDELIEVFEIYNNTLKLTKDIKTIEARTRRNIERFLNNYVKTGDNDILNILLNVITRYSDVYSNIIYISTTLRHHFFMLIISFHLKQTLHRLKVHTNHPELDEERKELMENGPEENNEEKENEL